MPVVIPRETPIIKRNKHLRIKLTSSSYSIRAQQADSSECSMAALRADKAADASTVGGNALYGLNVSGNGVRGASSAATKSGYTFIKNGDIDL
ncbi:MAG: hypothetical protein IH600_01430 [Bacteroidetes bacterium]|nr:hypothetical protein [Bacteroidota bacterium]